MKAINKLDLTIGEMDISVALYKAVDNETSFSLISDCCNAKVDYKRFCSVCNKELDYGTLKKAIKGTTEVIDTESLKDEKSNLRVVGTIKNQFLFYRNIYYVLPYGDKKMNKEKLNKIVERFSYLRESLVESEKLLIARVVLRDKEKYLALIPYEIGFLGIEIIYNEFIRDIQDGLKEVIKNLLNEFKTDKKVIKSMSDKIKAKENVDLTLIKDKRTEKIIEMMNKPKKTEKELKVEVKKRKKSTEKEVLENLDF